MAKPPYKVAVNYCIYNEQRTIQKSILDVARKLRGIDFIYILDGAWKWTGGKAHSYDKTVERIDECRDIVKDSYDVDIIFEQPDEVYRTQGDKRNNCLHRAEEIMKQRDPDAKWYNIVIDGDEFIGFPNGLHDLLLTKRESGVDQLWPVIGSINCFADGSSLEMWSPRFLPAFQGIHYHTDQRMIIHDSNCIVMADYNLKVKNLSGTRKLNAFFIINKWNRREIASSLAKIAYNTNTYPNKPEPCGYKKILTTP